MLHIVLLLYENIPEGGGFFFFSKTKTFSCLSSLNKNTSVFVHVCISATQGLKLEPNNAKLTEGLTAAEKALAASFNLGGNQPGTALCDCVHVKV